MATGESKITFADVAGVDEAIEELAEVRDYLGSPDKFLAMGAAVPKGILLTGPPGCGKTLLARALAGEANVPFFSISGSEFVEIFVGVGASRIRDFFAVAKSAAPCIVFIDELDAVGRGRTAMAVGGQDEREATLNQLLVEMDGFECGSGVIVLAATNRPDILDAALLRPGRFDRRVGIDRPDVRGREGVLKIHARGKPLAAEIDMAAVAKRTVGFSGADLANVVNEAALLAARRGSTQVEAKHMFEAIERVVAGPERHTRILSPQDRYRIAFHEAGHAVAATALPGTDRVGKLSHRGPGTRRRLHLVRARGRQPLRHPLPAPGPHRRHDGWPGGRGDRHRRVQLRLPVRPRAGRHPGPAHGGRLRHVQEDGPLHRQALLQRLPGRDGRGLLREGGRRHRRRDPGHPGRGRGPVP